MSHKILSDYQNRYKFSDAQLEQITFGLLVDVDVDFYANPKISADDMNIIRRGLMRGCDMSKFKRIALSSRHSQVGNSRLKHMSSLCLGLSSWLVLVTVHGHLGLIATRTSMLIELVFLIATLWLYSERNS